MKFYFTFLATILFIVQNIQSEANPKLFLIETAGTSKMLPLNISGAEPAAFSRIFEGRNAELISEKHTWTEGPVVFQNRLTGHDILMFSDVKENKMWMYQEGKLEERMIGTSQYRNPQVHTDNSGGCHTKGCFAKVEAGSNGLAYDAINGNLLICQHGARAVSKLPINVKTGIPLQVPFQTVVNFVEDPASGRFHSPNDIAVHPTHNGRIFFTDPPYGLGEKGKKEVPFNGVYQVLDYIKKPMAQLIDKELTTPNGVAISPDGKKLFVSESCTHEWSCPKGFMMYHVYGIDLKNRQKLPRKITSFNFTIEGKNDPSDGIKIHPSTGLLVSSCPQGICIVGSPVNTASQTDNYKLLAYIKFLESPNRVSNLAFGSNYLYLTGDRSIWRIKLCKKDDCSP